MHVYIDKKGLYVQNQSSLFCGVKDYIWYG